jgi:surface antigen
MARSALRLVILVMLAAGLTGRAFAQPAETSPRYWFLDRLGASDLKPADWALLRQNIQLALYELTDGESVGWTEPESGHSGSVRVVSTVTDGDRVCRRLRVSVDADAGSDDGIFELCRSGNTGFWRLTTSTLALHQD